MRLIDADALIEKLPKEYLGSIIHAMINEAPTIEPKRGEWIVEPKNQGGLTPGGNAVKSCSNCGWIYGAHRIVPDYRFCPNCGADMKGADDE